MTRRWFLGAAGVVLLAPRKLLAVGDGVALNAMAHPDYASALAASMATNKEAVAARYVYRTYGLSFMIDAVTGEEVPRDDPTRLEMERHINAHLRHSMQETADALNNVLRSSSIEEMEVDVCAEPHRPIRLKPRA